MIIALYYIRGTFTDSQSCQLQTYHHGYMIDHLVSKLIHQKVITSQVKILHPNLALIYA